MATDDKTKKVPDSRKQSLYFDEKMISEMKQAAAKLDRSLSWVVQMSWKLSRDQIAKMPSIALDDE